MMLLSISRFHLRSRQPVPVYWSVSKRTLETQRRDSKFSGANNEKRRNANSSSAEQPGRSQVPDIPTGMLRIQTAIGISVLRRDGRFDWISRMWKRWIVNGTLQVREGPVKINLVLRPGFVCPKNFVVSLSIFFLFLFISL